MIDERCMLRRATLPLTPCDERTCAWYVREDAYNCCFWFLANIMVSIPNMDLSIDEIAELEGIDVEAVQDILQQALSKCRLNLRQTLKKM